MERVRFYSKEDLSFEQNLGLAELIFKNFDENNLYDIHDIIEFHHIKLYFDNNTFSKKWSVETINNYKEKLRLIWKTTAKFFDRIDTNNILFFFEELKFDEQESFWCIFDETKNLTKISIDTFENILNNDKFYIENFIVKKRLANSFENSIRNYLLNYEKTTELLLRQFVEQRTNNNKSLYFPNSLTQNDKENVISKYLDSEDVNLNYVQLIIDARDSSDLVISPKIKLKAIRTSEILSEKIIKEGYTWTSGCELGFSINQVEPKIISYKKNIKVASYSCSWLDKFDDPKILFKMFSELFEYTDRDGCMTLFSKARELDILDITRIKPKDSYQIGEAFMQKNLLANLQFIGYSKYLNGRELNIIEIIKSFWEALTTHFKIENFTLNLPEDNLSFFQKNRILSPEIELLTKQYKLYVEEGYIDKELLQISSNPIKIEDIPTLIDKKYAYAIGQESQKIMYLFFSPSSTLYFIEPYKKKYHNFYSLLISEDISLENFEFQFHKDQVNELIKNEYLFYDENKHIKIKKKILVMIIGHLYHNEVLNYWHFPEEFRLVIDQMENDNMIKFKNTLFSEPEQNYLNYFLNKSKFTNGMDLRNRYAHGTNSDSEIENENAYVNFMKLLILVILKIEDDLIISEKHILNWC